MAELTKKHKTYSITIYHKGIEIEMVCVTTSKKKFAELSGISLSHVNGYACSYDLRYPICNENPEKLYGIRGMGGESFHIFEKDKVIPLEEMKAIIDEHRKTYTNYRDYQKKTNSL